MAHYWSWSALNTDRRDVQELQLNWWPSLNLLSYVTPELQFPPRVGKASSVLSTQPPSVKSSSSPSACHSSWWAVRRETHAFTHYSGASTWRHAAPQARWEFSQSVITERNAMLMFAESLLPDLLLLFLTRFPPLPLHPHPSDAVTTNGKHPSISFSRAHGGDGLILPSV